MNHLPSVEEVSHIGEPQAQELSIIINNYRLELPDVTSEYNQQVHSQFNAVREKLIDCLTQLSIYQEILGNDQKDELSMAVYKQTVLIQTVIDHVLNFENQEMTDGFTSPFQSSSGSANPFPNNIDMSSLDASIAEYEEQLKNQRAKMDQYIASFLREDEP